MTIQEFNSYIKTLPLQTYIVEIKMKHSYEQEYTLTNQLLVVENASQLVWDNDWFEGQDDVEILRCVALDDVFSLEVSRDVMEHIADVWIKEVNNEHTD